MILCVGLNPAIDITYRVDRLAPGEAHRVLDVRRRAGGKAVNVARGVQALGVAVTTLLPLGGLEGADVEAELAAAGVPVAPVSVQGRTRHTVTVVDAGGEASAFNEPGAAVSEADWRSIRTSFAARCAGSAVVVLSGSTPPGVPVDGYAELTSIARAEGAQVIVDATGPALLHALDAGPALVKPNVAELAEVCPGLDTAAAVAALRARSPRTAVVLSLGAEGLLADTPDGVWRARPTRPLTGNPTGAGDAAVAALAVAHHLASPAGRLDWPVALRQAVGLSGSAVLQPVAGAVDLDVAHALAAQVDLRRLDLPR